MNEEQVEPFGVECSGPCYKKQMQPVGLGSQSRKPHSIQLLALEPVADTGQQRHIKLAAVAEDDVTAAPNNNNTLSEVYRGLRISE